MIRINGVNHIENRIYPVNSISGFIDLTGTYPARLNVGTLDYGKTYLVIMRGNDVIESLTLTNVPSRLTVLTYPLGCRITMTLFDSSGAYEFEGNALLLSTRRD